MNISKNQLLIFLLIMAVFAACSGNKNTKETQVIEKSSEEMSIDKYSLFDGKSLEGWKITEFGTQGPVLISDGKIILELWRWLYRNYLAKRIS